MTDLQSILTGPRFLRLGILLSQHTPVGFGRRLAWWAAGAVYQLKPAVVRIVESNLRQVMGSETSQPVLEKTVRQVFFTAIRGYHELFRAFRLRQDEMSTLVDVPETTKAIARSLHDREGGTVVVFPHLSNFDLGGHALAPYLPESQLFTLPDPPPGFQLINQSRSRSGVQVTPLSPAALRGAIRLLRRGGVVFLAGDRPVSELDRPVPFFGRPARVPSGHIRLALQTGAGVAVCYCVLSPETQRYSMHLEPTMKLMRTGNRGEEVLVNLKRVLEALERIICRWPEQWLMFVPVWPELLEG